MTTSNACRSRPSRRATSAAASPRAAPTRTTIARLAGSPAAACCSTSGAAGGSGTASRLSRCSSCAAEAQPASGGSSSLRLVAGPRPVQASATAWTASSATSVALPKSPYIGPSPKVRKLRPAGSRPAATVPVPAITTTPNGRLAPARRAMNESFSSVLGPPSPSGSTSAASIGRSSSQSSPARPNALAARSPGRTPAAASAPPTASASAALAASSPASSQLERPLEANPSVSPRSSATSACVLEPPPSTPRTTLTARAPGRPARPPA